MKTSVFLDIFRRYNNIGSLASGQAVREPLFFQFFLNGKAYFFQDIGFLYVFSRP